jgi:hypothetical protein
MRQLLNVEGRAVENAAANIESGYFAAATVRAFNEFLRFGIRVDVDLFEWNLPYPQELLSAAAIVAPRRSIHFDG